MKFYVLGVNHTGTPAEIRGRFAFTESGKIEFTAMLQDAGIPEVVILSTCNRSELFFFAREEAAQGVQQRLVSYLDVADCRNSLFSLEGRDAVLHLFRVTAGLDSVVVGEDQILGQVRQAHAFAASLGAVGKLSNRLFRDAVTLAKSIKTQTGISRIPLSASYIGVKLLSRELGGLCGKRFVLVGMGEVNRLTLQYLLDENAGEILLCTRSDSGAAQQGKACVRSVDFDGRYDLLGDVDAVVTATSSPHVIFRREGMPRLHRPMVFLDLAVPRDVDGDLAELPGVKVYTVDDLRSISQENLEKRQALTAQAEQQVQQAADAFQEWALQSRVDPTIRSLNQRCREITEDVSGYLAHKLELTEKEKKLVTKMVASGLRRLIREPVHKLKQARDQHKQDDYMALIEELFAFEEHEE